MQISLSDKTETVIIDTIVEIAPVIIPAVDLDPESQPIRFDKRHIITREH